MEAVVSAGHGVLGPLLGKLADMLAGKYGSIRGVRGEILSLQAELTSMHAALKNYSMLEDPDVQVKAWISLLRELAYDTEDCVDKFISRIGGRGRQGGIKEVFRKTIRFLKTLDSRCGIAGQIDELKARIRHVKELKDSYRMSDTPCGTTGHTTVDPRLCALFAEEAHLVGIDGPRDDLAKWMVEEGNKLPKVLSIVGFGGLGKTTLANEVYRKVEGNFDCRAFVSVSQKPVLKKIIKDLIYKVSCPDGFTKDIDIWDEMTCIAKLREVLKDKRYLVIVDDIWSAHVWNTIKCAFPENNCSSRIITTTRNMDVARSCCPGGDDRVYEMEALSYLDSKRLFLKRIFGSEDSLPDMLKEVSNKILKKCGGLPLAIISISGLLANRPVVKEEWEKVKSSIGSALEENRCLEGMNNILSLSYNDLPPNLKTCYLYLSTFPEDYMIDRERLVRRWIAEGFICNKRGQSQQEVAEGYFYELINKSMVQPVDICHDGKVRACRVHDMMLDIIISKSAENNFMTVVGGAQMSLLNRHGTIRRLSIQHIDNELAFALENEDLSHVRSLTVTAPDCTKHLPSLSKFEALRVLDFEGCMGLEQYDMNGVDKLVQLKYLGLNKTDISRLPSRIVMLSDLETLDFRNTSVQELPSGFVKLTKLQHLLATRLTKIPSGIGIMRNLRVISRINGTMSLADALEELGNLTSLTELHVYLQYGEFNGGPDACKRHKEKLFSSLHKLIDSCKLQSLQISSVGDHSLELLESWSPMRSALQKFHMNTSYYFRNIPKWIAPTLASLTSLDINLIELTEDGMHSLGELPALLCLILTLKTGGYKITVEGIGFPSLKHFEICQDGKGTYITFVKGAMPKLEYLELRLDVSMGRNDGFYLGLGYLPCLKSVEIWFQPEGTTESEIIAARAAITEEVDAHTNHPTVCIFRWEGDKGKNDNDEERAMTMAILRRIKEDIATNYEKILVGMWPC